jgi:glutamyl-tRNA reductase
MSVLVVGLSHKSAPLPVLERAAVSGDALVKLTRDVYTSEHVAGAFVVATCNRVEVYAEVGKFHAALSAISELLARHSSIDLAELTRHLYVHYEDRAIQHLLAVTCGLDSMVVGEAQILGQVRQALKSARAQGVLSRGLSDAGRAALRAGKRAHAETGIDRAGATMISVGIDLAAGALRRPGEFSQAQPGEARPGPARPGPDQPGQAGPLAGASVLVVGAGSMSALAAKTAADAGAARITVANRTRDHAERLAAAVDGTAADLSALPATMADADLVISCTGAAGLVITEASVRDALTARARPLVLLDLALPHDVDPAVAGLPDVTAIGLDEIRKAAVQTAQAAQGGQPAPARAGRSGEAGHSIVSARSIGHSAEYAQAVAAVRQIVAEEVAAQASAVQAARVAPTVVALRAKAAKVVDAELARLGGRLSGIDGQVRDEIAKSMSRVVDKLLHGPTVRVKELAGSPDGDSYATALRVLFDLDQKAVEAVTHPDLSGVSSPQAPQAGPSQDGPPQGGSLPSPQAGEVM